MERADYPSNTLFAGLAGRAWIILVVAAWIIAILSLGVHDMMLTKLGIPFPDNSAVPQWAKFVDVSVRIGAIAGFCHLSRATLARMSPVGAAMLMGLLLVLLNETLRVFTVDIYLTKGWIDCRWLYTVVDTLPGAIYSFYCGAVGSLIARLVGRRDLRWTIGSTFLAAAFGVFALRPALHAGAAAIEQAFHLSETPELYQLPYSFAVYRVIYSTFIEPTVAVFVMAALVWPGLRANVLVRPCSFVALMLLIRGRVIAEGLFSFWVPERLGLAFLSESQFLLETLVLATLVGFTWAGLHHRRSLPTTDI